MYEDRLLRGDTSELLKECYTLSKSLHDKNIFSWYTYANHIRKDSGIDYIEENLNTNKNKNNQKQIYKNRFNNLYIDLYNNKIQQIDDNSKLQVFKLVKKTEYELEYFLKYPDIKARKLICKLRISDHSLGIETGRYKKIPRDLRICNKCDEIDDEFHFFFSCKINENIRKSFLDSFLSEVHVNTNDDKIKQILNPNSIQQVKSLGSFIKQSYELRTGGN